MNVDIKNYWLCMQLWHLEVMFTCTESDGDGDDGGDDGDDGDNEDGDDNDDCDDDGDGDE